MTVKRDRPKIVVVLANEMDQDGTLNPETRGRLERGCALAVDLCASEVIFMGWAYRKDSALPISEAMQAEALRRNLCPGISLRCNRLSRDTVGDAIFSAAEFWPDLDRIDPVVVTSDYHGERTGQVFSTVWGRPVPVFGAATGVGEQRSASEAQSLAAFRRTFDGVAPGDLPGFAARLIQAHPFYNGSAMPDRPFDPAHLGAVLDASGQGY